MSFWRIEMSQKSFKNDLLFPGGKPLCSYSADDEGISYPSSLDMRDLVLRTENQGQTSMCAAYTATSWLESLMWRRTGIAKDYDPKQLYEYAKKIDGVPDQDGTTLNAVMEGMIDLGWCEGCAKKDIIYIYNDRQLRRALHRYVTALLGLTISSDWYDHRDLVLRSYSGSIEGGHAVICTGYNDVGVFIQNSWGTDWGKYGFACITWDVFNHQFMYGAYLRNCLDGVEK